MKKILLVLLAAMLLISSGCAGKEKAPETEPVFSIPALTEAPETEALTEAPEETTEGTAEETQKTPEETEETEAEEKAEKPQAVSGVIANTGFVNVRQGPSVNTKIVKKLHKNDPVTVTESITLDAVTWAHAEEGWICTDYLKLDGPLPGSQPREDGSEIGVIYHTDSLNVREKPDMKSKVVGKLKRNDLVTIFETEKVGPGLWGRTETGWISMDYVQLQHPVKPQDGSSQDGSSQDGKPLAGSNGMTAPPATQPSYPAENDKPFIEDGPWDDGPHVHPNDRPENQHPCQHPSWKLYRHVDEEWLTLETYTCQCGEDFANLPGWEVHSAVAGKENPDAHTTYSYSSEKKLVHRETDWWECEKCGVVKTTYDGEKP